MNWNYLEENRPIEQGIYLVSISEKSDIGTYLYVSLAVFDLENNVWLENNDEKKELKSEIIAWIKTPPPTLGIIKSFNK